MTAAVGCSRPIATLVTVLTASTVSAAAEPSLCQRLGEAAQRIPAQAWSHPSHDPMHALLQARATQEPRTSPSTIERQLARDPGLREGLSISPEANPQVERLAGTDVYRLDTFEGSANCQVMHFVEAVPGQLPRRLPAPFDAAPCVTERGLFGQAFGQPLFVVGGRVAMDAADRRYTVAAWRGQRQGWGPRCELELNVATVPVVADRYCGSERTLCHAAEAEVARWVEAYRRAPALEPLRFAGDRQPPSTLVEQLRADAPSPGPFPTFGATTPRANDGFLTSYSNARDPGRLALWLDHRWWLGIVGVAGVGWRSSTTTLVAIYAVTEAGLVPAAGFQVDLLPTGPARANWR